MRFDRKKSEQIADDIMAQKKECYKNCTLAYFALRDKDKQLRYVEGIYYLPLSKGTLFPIEHAWLISGSNLYDPTLILIEDNDASLTPDHYEAQKVFTPEEMQRVWDAVMSGATVVPPYSQYGIPKPKKRKPKTVTTNLYANAAQNKGFLIRNTHE